MLRTAYREFEYTITQVARPDGYHVALEPEPLLVDFEAAADDYGAMAEVEVRGEANDGTVFDAPGDAYAYAA